MKLDLHHPFGNHLYIHALEASSHPERALSAADRMRDLYPGIAHNVRMPSHIDIRIGHWNEALSANLMQAGHFAEAEQVYREDLGLLPENGWSLYGLTRSLKLQHKTDEAAMVDARFQKVWSKATVNITSSCFCQPGI